MATNIKVGIYFCNCGTNIASKIDSTIVKEKILENSEGYYFKTIDFMCSEEGKEFFENDLKQEKPDRVVVAACSPRDHENTFMRILSNVGINPYLMHMVSIREQIAWVTPDKDIATGKAISYIKAAIARVKLHKPLQKTELEMCPDVLIIGAGPAGLKTALSLSQSDRKVILVEKSPAMGGLPVKYEEVFPNMECGPCMLEPMLDDLLHGECSKNIELLTLSEIVDVTGYYGNFIVKIKQSPRYIDIHQCIGCGECITPCPAPPVKNEFNNNIGERKSIAFPFMGALPNVPFIDANSCLKFKGEDCQICKTSCPMGEDIINFEDQQQVFERNVGAIVLATGAALYDCANFPKLAYGKILDVYDSFQFERIISSSGPTGGEIKTAAGSQPEAITIIHCVGSLDKNHKEYCSGICCSEAFKLNHIIKNKIPNAKIYHLYKELVIPGKDEFALYHHAKDNPNAVFIRYKEIDDLTVSSNNDRMRVSLKNIYNGNEEFVTDMVILCPAVVPAEAGKNLSKMLEVSQDKFGFFEELHSRLDSAQTKIKGIYLAGNCQSPMDIQKTTNQAMAATGYILAGLSLGKKLEIEPIVACVDENRCAGCRLCISVCPYKAICFDNDKDSAVVNDVLCYGCGTCVTACPAGAMDSNHFTTEAILTEIEGVLL